MIGIGFRIGTGVNFCLEAADKILSADVGPYVSL